jgi:succinate dehydrogenase/fumarate reductase flavoprotein subunit
MSNLESIGEVFAGDVLVIGGGIAGLIAANRIKESNPQLQVRIVEKSTTGWAGGKANKGGGILQVVVEEDQVEAYQDYHVKNVGLFLNDQELLEKYVKGQAFMRAVRGLGHRNASASEGHQEVPTTRRFPVVHCCSRFHP